MTAFETEFRILQKDTYRVAKIHGFQESENNSLYVPTKLALIISEASEALEAHREGKNGDLSHELADIVIRTMDLAESLSIDLANEIVNKHNFNKTREYNCNHSITIICSFQRKLRK